jgi:hypothetical protein
MAERVQVQGLGDAVPGLQPTIQRAGQYSVGQRRAGRNKLMDLADALSQVNPILQQYGNIRRLEQERKKSLEEALEKEGYRAYQTSPATMAVELEKTQAKIRAATERGEIPDEANVPRIMGALKAKAEVLAKRDYRNILMNPELLESETDPVAEAARQREEFLKRPEFESPSVRDHVFQHLEKVENEFVNKVESRLGAQEVEEGKQNWLLTGKDAVNQVIGGELDVNDPIIKNWINDPAGLFKGSRKYAWDNLMKEELKEGLTSGAISPTQAVKFLDNLRELDLGGGVKFADAETGNSISDFYDVIENQRGVLENKAAQKANLEFELLNNGLVDSLLESLGEGNNVSSVDARNIRESYLSFLPKAISKEKAIDTFDKILGNVNKPGSDATKLITGKLDTLIEEGFELDAAVAEVQSTFESGGITVTDRNRLLKKIEDSRDFDRLIYKADFYRNIITVDEELITGFVKERAAFTGATYEVGYFTDLGVPEDVDVKKRTTDERSVFSSITNKKGSFAAKSFVNRRYNAYELSLREAFESKFKRYESDPAFTPEQAQEKIIEEAEIIRNNVFMAWEIESIRQSNAIYDTKIVMPKRLSVSGVDRFRK